MLSMMSGYFCVICVNVCWVLVNNFAIIIHSAFGLFSSTIFFSAFPSIVFVCSSMINKNSNLFESMLVTCQPFRQYYSLSFWLVFPHNLLRCFSEYSILTSSDLMSWLGASHIYSVYLSIYIYMYLHQILFSHFRDIVANRRAKK